MDINIIYFTKKTKLVECWYIGSEFFGYASHQDIFAEVKKSNEGLDITHNLFKISWTDQVLTELRLMWFVITESLKAPILQSY